MGNTVARAIIQGKAGPPLLVFMLGWVCVGKEQSPEATLRLVPMVFFLLLAFPPSFKWKIFPWKLKGKSQQLKCKLSSIFILYPGKNYLKSVYLVFFLLLNVFLQSKMQILPSLTSLDEEMLQHQLQLPAKNVPKKTVLFLCKAAADMALCLVSLALTEWREKRVF